MEHENNDNLLVARVQRGDKRAFDLLVKKYQYRIGALVGRLVRDTSQRDDIVQEAFIKAYRAIGNFRGDSAFYTWLYRITVNTAKNYLMAAARQPPMQDVDAGLESPVSTPKRLVDTNTPVAIMQNDQLAAAIRDAIAALPADLRQAIILRELDGLSYEDIAVAMDCPVGTVRSRIFRARDTVQQAMAPLMDSPPTGATGARD